VRDAIQPGGKVGSQAVLFVRTEPNHDVVGAERAHGSQRFVMRSGFLACVWLKVAGRESTDPEAWAPGAQGMHGVAVALHRGAQQHSFWPWATQWSAKAQIRSDPDIFCGARESCRRSGAHQIHWLSTLMRARPPSTNARRPGSGWQVSSISAFSVM
jgi:hypothetical protein